jgi:secretion/DNA translocation related TadE-like protein
MPFLRGERGAGSILVVAVIGSVLCLSALSLPLYSVLAAKRVTEGAADAAVLAAADVAVGRAPGAPCAAAAEIAQANNTVLTACQPDGLVVTVRVQSIAVGFTVTATATAGPAVTEQ